MLEDYPDVLTVEEACEALSVGYNAVYELLNSGKLKAHIKTVHLAHPPHRTDTIHSRKCKNQASMTQTPRCFCCIGEHRC